MKEIIKEVINNYLESKCIMENEHSLWEQSDLDVMENCKQALIELYKRKLKRGYTKNVFIIKQLEDVIKRLDKLEQ